MSEIGKILPSISPQVVNSRHPRSPIPESNYINVSLFISHPDPKPFPASNSIPEEIKKRFLEHIRNLEALFETKCGKKLKIRNVWRTWDNISTTAKVQLRAEEIPVDIEKAEEVTKQRTRHKGYFPEINIMIWYILGDYLSLNENPNKKVVGRAYSDVSDDPCALVFITEKAGPYALAHEIGHILSDFEDPDPDPEADSKAHNKNPDNLMYFEEGELILLLAQCENFFKHKFIKAPN